MAEIQDILNERQKTHGDYREHAHVTQELKDIMRNHSGWDRLSAIQRESLDMFAHKIGRILSGNPAFEDHWDDIAGYAKLIPNMQALDKGK
ncbi:MAG: DUF6378 domain-containing protein [Candidatus Paceibacterota bacterium]|jgi:hypothetical protein